MAIETPQYEVLDKNGRIEFRRYRSYITANVEIKADSYSSAANKAFRTLADYIFGNNTKQTKIAMTAPVISQKSISSETIAMTTPVAAAKLNNETYVIAFSMPSSYSLEDLPLPNNKEVSIKKISSHEAVVIRFSGYTTEAKIEKMTNELKKWAKQKQLILAGEPTVLRYDPPWKPGFIRRNEVSIDIK